MNKKPYLLVVEDDPAILSQLEWSFEAFEVITASTCEDAIKQLRRFEPGVVTLDLGLPPDPNGVKEGMRTLKALIQLKSETKIIMVTGQGDRAHAIEAVSMGAYDFYTKPIDKDELNLIVQRAQHLYELESENRALTASQTLNRIPNFQTASPSMDAVCQTIERVASTNITTLLLGESGTGKEVLAKALHDLSDRKNKPFVAINCAAIPDTLLESELFGYEKGAFTGASKQTPGKIELANQGTLFLDEVGDLPHALQPKLLRFLQERQVERLGGRKPIDVNVRVICATHQDLSELIEAQKFREDLFYRISEILIKIPPLRDRDSDATLLALSFVKKYSKDYNAKVKGLSEDAKEVIAHYSWPGNVRELENRIKRAVVMAQGQIITQEDLDLPSVDSHQQPFNLKEVRDNAERQAILTALAIVQGNMTKASELLGITRPTLYHTMEKLGLQDKVK